MENNTIKELLITSGEEVNEKIIADIQQTLNPLIARLDQIYKNLKEKQRLIEVANNKILKIEQLVGESVYRFRPWEQIREHRQELKGPILEMYELTTKILSTLKLIPSVNYTVAYIDEDGKYTRLGNFDLKAEHTYLKGGALTMNESAIRKAVEQYKKDSNASDLQNKINEHYQAFIRPYNAAEKKSKNAWKANRGKMVEAFERHWEELNHSIERPEEFDNNSSQHFGTVGYRWALYALSSGNAAFFTGPDTLFSQVKKENATILHNLDTVLKAVDFIFVLNSSSAEWVQAHKQEIRQALQQVPTVEMDKKLESLLSKTAISDFKKGIKKLTK